MVTCAVIMAGGKEMRFGPVKKFLGSKQMQRIDGREEILNETISRCKPIIGEQSIYIVTNEEQKKIIEEKILRNDEKKYRFLTSNFIIEPAPIGTAPCILLSAKRLIEDNPNQEVIMCVFPSDHDIPEKKCFQKDLRKAIKIARQTKKIVTIGIEMEFPATGYGYIKYSKDDKSDYHSVNEFKEKPDYELAEKYHESKEWFWNSGIFIWDLNTIVELYKKHQKEMYEKIFNIRKYYDIGDFEKELTKSYMEIGEVIKKDLRKKNVDRAILEETSPDNIKVIKSTFKWDDIGKWDALLAVYTHDDSMSKVDLIGVDTINKTIYSSGKYVYNLNTERIKDEKDNRHKWLYCNKENENDVLAMLVNNNLVKNIKEFSSKETEETQKALQKEMSENLDDDLSQTAASYESQAKEDLERSQDKPLIEKEVKNESRTCFVIMPFGDPFNKYYKEILIPSIKSVNLIPVRGDEIDRPGVIMDQIRQSIEKSKVCIADITGRNANVMYELGLAHALGKPVIPIVQDKKDLPFDIESYRSIIYDPKSPKWRKSFIEKLISMLENYDQQ